MHAVFDTNILIDFLNGVPQAASEIGLYSERMISIITYMEVLVGAKTPEDDFQIRSFLANFDLITLSPEVADETVRLRKLHRRKLPDAIIYASAKTENAILITRNSRDFDAALPDIRIPYQL